MINALQRARAVIFDFDGVLADSEPLHCHAIRVAARLRGWSVSDEQFQRMIGKGDPHAFELLARENDQPITGAEIAHLIDLKQTACLRGIADGRFTPQPGAADLVRWAAARVPTAVCSGSSRPFVAAILEKMDLLSVLRTVVGLEDVSRPKPDPDPYLIAASRLEVTPADCVVIEDTPTGIHSARAAGMHVIGVCHSFPRDRLVEAHEVVDRIADLLP